jgi:membrane dipeptidase
MWSISTNVLTRTARQRSDVFYENLTMLRSTLEASPHVAIVRDATELRAARAAGKHAALLAVQGGNAFESRDPANPGRLVTRVTVVHLSSSVYGATSSPARGKDDMGMTMRGRDFVRWLDAERIFVDLAHASPRTFWDAVETHDRSLPLIVTHTGIGEVHRMWRNIDAKQVRAIADTGGVVAIIFHGAFLGPRATGRSVLDHVEAAIAAGGEDCVALGSDYDGFIVPPRDLRDGGAGFYRLVSYMLERRWPEARIRRVLGENFVRSFALLRP